MLICEDHQFVEKAGSFYSLTLKEAISVFLLQNICTYIHTDDIPNLYRNMPKTTTVSIIATVGERGTTPIRLCGVFGVFGRLMWCLRNASRLDLPMFGGCFKDYLSKCRKTCRGSVILAVTKRNLRIRSVFVIKGNPLGFTSSFARRLLRICLDRSKTDSSMPIF